MQTCDTGNRHQVVTGRPDPRGTAGRHTRMTRRLLVAVAAMLLAATACSGGSGDSSTTGSKDTSSATPVAGGRHLLDEKDNGTKLDVQFGDTLVVTLHSTYWSFLPTDGLAIQSLGDPATAPATNCPPPMNVTGSGCGTVTGTFNVGHIGTSTLKAHRDSCGEALRCTGKDADWSVTIVAH